MGFLVRRHPYGGYSKVETEDGEEMRHHKAQILIQKVLQQADSRRSKPSWLIVTIGKLKMKTGNRMKKLKGDIFVSASSTARIN